MSARAAPVDRLLVLLVLAGVACWMMRAHWETKEIPFHDAKVRLHQQVIENEAADPYQYKLWVITHALEWARQHAGMPAEDAWERVFFWNTGLALVFLVLLHHLWLRTYFGAGTALIGALALAALANVLFLTGRHHPYEYWGMGLFCLLLRSIARGVDWRWLALLGLVTGLVWEKHALLAPLWGLRTWMAGKPFWGTAWRASVFFIACLAVPVFVRIHLGDLDGTRVLIDGMTTLSIQDWDKVLWFQVPYILPFLAILLLRPRCIPGWVRLCWLYLPVLVAAYVFQRYILHEVRSFWALAPVFTATLCAWLATLRAPAEPTPAAPA